MADRKVFSKIECIGCRALLEENQRLRSALEKIAAPCGKNEADYKARSEFYEQIAKAALDGEDSK